MIYIYIYIINNDSDILLIITYHNNIKDTFKGTYVIKLSYVNNTSGHFADAMASLV